MNIEGKKKGFPLFCGVFIILEAHSPKILYAIQLFVYLLKEWTKYIYSRYIKRKYDNYKFISTNFKCLSCSRAGSSASSTNGILHDSSPWLMVMLMVHSERKKKEFQGDMTSGTEVPQKSFCFFTSKNVLYLKMFALQMYPL